MTIRTPAHRLLFQARLRLAGLSLLVMGALLYGAGFAMGRLLLQSQESAIRRELQALAGTLHEAAVAFREDVEAGRYPSAEHEYEA